MSKHQFLILLVLIISPLWVVAQGGAWNGLSSDINLVSTYMIEDPRFIEGFFYDPESELLYESYGLYQESGIRAYPLEDVIFEEDIQTLYENPEEEFAEGLARIGETFYQLTYQEGILNSFHEEIENDGRRLVLDQRYSIPRDEDWVVPEGWGLTSDGEEYLYMSDGSNRIFRIDPRNLLEFDQDEFERNYAEGECPDESLFDETYSIFNPNAPEISLGNLNELELVGDILYANILDFSVNTFYIASIEFDGNTLAATHLYDLCYLYSLVCSEIGEEENCRSPREFNGIAFHDPTQTFLLTGKEWPMIFSVELN